MYGILVGKLVGDGAGLMLGSKYLGLLFDSVGSR